MDQSHLRHHFDIPDQLAYFNAPKIGPMPKCAVEAGALAYQSKAQPWVSPSQDIFFDRPERLRGLGAKLLGCSNDDVALIPAASYGLAVAARNIALQPGDEILILDGQFPSNVYTWQALAARTGAKMVQVDRSDNLEFFRLWLTSFGGSLDFNLFR